MTRKNRPLFYPPGIRPLLAGGPWEKSGKPHLLFWPGLGVYEYNFTLAALDLQPPKLLQQVSPV
ncbi:MAG: hypothetical protein C0407_04865 [Desulfobacca sp.]|nr:hypothetical protein [Desulfobacca sp.]